MCLEVVGWVPSYVLSRASDEQRGGKVGVGAAAARVGKVESEAGGERGMEERNVLVSRYSTGGVGGYGRG